MFNLNAHRRDKLVKLFVIVAEQPTLWFLSGLVDQHARWGITQKAGVVGQRGIGWIAELRLVSSFLVMGPPDTGWSETHNFAGVFMNQEGVFIGMRFLFAPQRRGLLL